MTIDNWESYIDSNFSNDKLNVLFDMVEQQRINYREFKILLEYVQGK